MIRIGNSTIKPITIKVLIFLIILPTIFIIYRLSTFEYTREDFEDDLSGQQKLEFQLRSFQDEKEKLFKTETTNAKIGNYVSTGFMVLIYIGIVGFIVIVSDRQMRNTPIGRVAGQYIKWEFFEMFKDKKRGYEIKDYEHKDKLSEIEHKQRMRDIEYLAPLAKINLDNAKTDIEKARAAIISDAINYMYRMSDRWRAYIFACANGSAGTVPDDEDLKSETEKIKKDIEYEKWRKENIDNDDRKRRADENKAL